MQTQTKQKHRLSGMLGFGLGMDRPDSLGRSQVA